MLILKLFIKIIDKFQFISFSQQPNKIRFPINNTYVPNYEKFGYLGQDQILAGSYQDYRSSQLVLTCLEEFKPKCCLLGGMNYNDFQEIIQGYDMYQKQNSIYNADQDLLAKSLFLKYFETDMQKQAKYFLIPKYNILYRADLDLQRGYLDNYLSAAYLYSRAPDRILLFGKPDMNLFFEDIALRLSLKDLKSIFQHIIAFIYEKSVEQQWPAEFEMYRVIEEIQSATKQLYSEQLFLKQLIYNVSLQKKSARIFKKSGLIIDHEFLKIAFKIAKEPLLPEHDMIFRTYMTQSQSGTKFQSQHRLAKKINQVFKDDVDRELIKKQLIESSSKYNFFEKEKELFDNIDSMNCEEILEKYVILSYLIDPSYRNYLENGINPFKITIFENLFSEISAQQILEKFIKLSQPYREDIHRLQNHFIKRINVSGLNDCGRQFLITFNEQLQRQEKKKTDFGIKFQVGLLNKSKQAQIICSNILNKMQELIQKRQNQGINQTNQIQSLKEVMQGTYSEDSLRQFNQLMVEANNELGGILKFPKYFQQYLSYVSNVEREKFIKNLDLKLKKIDKIVQIEKEKFILQHDSLSGNIEILDSDKLSQKRFSNLKLNEQMDKINIEEDEFSQKLIESEQDIKNEALISKTFIIGNNTQDFPQDLANKSVEELLKMGLKPIGDTTVKLGQDGDIIDSDMDSEQKEKLKSFLQQLNQQNVNNKNDIEK